MAEQNTSEQQTALPERPGRKKGVLIGVAVAVVIALVAVILLVTTNNDDSAASGGNVTVRIGTTEASSEYWTVLKEVAAEEGITIETVNFGDYTQANPALSQGQIDLNLFQHLLFLANYNVASDDTLTPIASTYIVPLALYSRKHTAVEDIPDGASIAIPNDPTNQARALLVLQEAGLLKLRDGGNVLSTPAEIDTSASKVTVTAVDAAQTVAALPSVDASIVNNNYATDGGLDPSKALFSDDPASAAAEPYINVIVARAQDKDNPTYAKVAELYRHPRVTEKVQAESGGTSVLVDRPAAELEQILSSLGDTVGTAGQ
ncbi:methionine ABC transporter substrate-binding protein [Prauserella marina]|uniref:D-methionine transport system substrate-binding protein n=1 Tax=Prauserella marina TaxID=530584 RepID=A0A222VQZ1_9PSEU|nr:MetQ/NlpA family ABC transporter substrate-binding protein [Prauserella marina]ASR36355.1 methionine ABC transporter substrate-binding protein [Prauserella marina]PWV77146.1 D-methionine transport system substrate-binding protein [Prauserella marina]SDD05492.1 D-methionine transport system substrate-binding protein [Prauserella marina]